MTDVVVVYGTPYEIDTDEDTLICSETLPVGNIWVEYSIYKGKRAGIVYLTGDDSPVHLSGSDLIEWLSKLGASSEDYKAVGVDVEKA